MRYHLKRIAAFAAALLIVFSAVFVLLPVLLPVSAADDPLAREEDVFAWELVDMRTDLNPDEELYKSPAKYQASQFEHIMLYDGDVHTSKMGDLPSVVEDGASFKISMAAHISNGDSGSTGLMDIVEIFAYDSKGQELPKRHQDCLKLAAYGEKDYSARFRMNEDDISRFEIVWTSRAGKSVWVYKAATVKKTITGGYWQLKEVKTEVPDKIVQSAKKIDPESTQPTSADESFTANGDTHQFKHEIYALSEDTKQQGLYAYYNVTTTFSGLPGSLSPGQVVRVHISIKPENVRGLFKRIRGPFDADSEDATMVEAVVNSDAVGGGWFTVLEREHNGELIREKAQSYRNGTKRDVLESDSEWTVPEYEKRKDGRYDTIRITCISQCWLPYIGGFMRNIKTIHEYQYIQEESVLAGFTMVGGGETEPEKPIEQEVITPADEKPGEDKGTDIIEEIVEGSKGKDTAKKAAIAAGGALAAGGIGALVSGNDGGDENDKKKKKPSGYRMYVNKDFGNMLRRGEAAKFVYARIAELPAGGGEVSRDDLSAKIEVFSGDGVLEVTDGGFTSNGYRAARVVVPEGCTATEGCVSFRYTGEGGTFTRHVVFALTAAEILFPQENLGLPAGKLKYVKKAEGKDSRIGDGTYTLPFAVKDMPPDPKLSVVVESVGTTNLSGHYLKESGADKPVPYSVTLEPDKEYKDKGIYNAVIKETADYELEPGVTEGFVLRITAEHGTPGDKDYEKAEGELPLYRIHLGLALTVEAKSIPCYVKLKPGREKKERDKITGEDLEIQCAYGSLLLLLCDESDMSIVRIPVSPQMEADGKRPMKLKVTPTKVGNDRYCRTGDLNDNHQKICDSLGICAFPTGELRENGAHKIKFCITDGTMDPPTRMLADIELTAEYGGKTYTARKNLLLRSQDFRIAQNSDDDRAFLEKDKHVTEQLLHISEKIHQEYPLQLFSLADMIDRMVEGFDERFGYDENQLNNVMGMWTGFLEGSFAGANGTPQGVTFADELAAVYAFMQGLRDNTGFLGRVAMGVMTSGVSEYIFTTMTVAEKMREAVFKCKGDKDFGFWDGVEIGVTEFGKQILLELAMGAAIKKFGSTKIGYKVGEKLGDIATKYRNAMDAMDTTLKENVKLYKMADDALTSCKNFFNSSAKSAKAGIDETLQSADEAAEYGEQLMKKARNELTPEQLAALERFERGMEKGMEKVRRLQKAQQELDSITDPAKLKEAQANYRKIADEVWTDKNALKALQRVKGEPAARIKAQFNQYRETLLDEVQLEALSDIAKETGIPRENLYVMNASNGSKAAYRQGKKVPSDRDISFKQKVLSDRTKDLTIDQSIGEKAVARRLFKKMNGREADSIDEALAFMEGKDVTYVHPEKSSAGDLVFEHNLEAYEDLSGMLGIKGDGSMDKGLMKNDLHNLQINRASIEHKGAEWFSRSRKTAETARTLQAEAANLSGEAKEALLARADDLLNQSQGQMCEGVYQITKQMENIVIPRGVLRTGKCPLPKEAMIIHQQALKVANYEQAPAVFENFLKKNYNMDMNGYAKYMSQFLN